MSYTDAPIPQTPEAKFAFERKGINERVGRLEKPGKTPADIPIPMIAGSLFSGFVLSTHNSVSFTSIYRSTEMTRPYFDAVIVQFEANNTNIDTGSVYRLRDMISGATTSSASIGGNDTAPHTITFKWLHEQNTDFANSEPFVLSVDSRRLGGGGSSNHNLFNPFVALFISSNLLDGASTTGAPTVT